MEHEGETRSPPGPRPKGLRGQTKSESGKDLSVHETGTSGIANSNLSPKVQQVQYGPLNTEEHKVQVQRDKPREVLQETPERKQRKGTIAK